MNKITKNILTIIVSIPVGIYGGFTLSSLWNWFVVPFVEVPSMNIVTGIGIMLLVASFHIDTKKGESYEPTVLLISRVIQFTLLLIFGYIWKLFL